MSTAEEPFRLARRRSAASAGSRAAPAGRARFTEEELLAAVRRWAERYGGPPRASDWEPSRARLAGRPLQIERFRAGDWPSAGMLRRRFGSFNAALRAAGFEPRTAPSRTATQLTSPVEVLRAIVEWNRRYGVPPTQSDWDTSRAARSGQEWRIVRNQAGDWPSFNTVRRHFGTMSRAVQAAGLEARKPGARAVPDGAGASAKRDELVTAVRAVARARRVQDRDNERRALEALAREAVAAARAVGR